MNVVFLGTGCVEEFKHNDGIALEETARSETKTSVPFVYVAKTIVARGNNVVRIIVLVYLFIKANTGEGTTHDVCGEVW